MIIKIINKVDKKRWRDEEKNFLIVSDDLTTRCSVRFLTTLMVWRRRERIKKGKSLTKKKRCLQYIKIVCFEAKKLVVSTWLPEWIYIEYLIDDPEAVIFIYITNSNSTLLNLEEKKHKNQKTQNPTKINKLNYTNASNSLF